MEVLGKLLVVIGALGMVVFSVAFVVYIHGAAFFLATWWFKYVNAALFG